MNETPALPPQLPATAATDNYVPIQGLVGTMEAILREPGRVLVQLQRGRAQLMWGMLLIALVCSLTYGLVVGSFSGNQQLWAAPLKVTGGLLLSGLICLPSLYILSCLSGSTARFAEVIGFLAGLMAITTVLLIGFAPVAWIFSQSTESVAMMGALHLLFWLIAICFGIRFLQTGFAQLASTKPVAIHLWTVVFILVQLQMTATLRPIVGESDTLLPTRKKFFLAHWAETLELSAKAQPQR